SGTGARLGMIVHHDDAEREYAYDRRSAVGRLDRALDDAASRGWLVASMRRDWRRVFA
ncbi:MAG: haloacid dehalogenase-like hydrolase, partial [bacterium]